ncbi:MAG: hypothetical protein LBN08_03780 [Lactobacillales bacterium]|jgi:hypothetical protein|nr:hypothetical protein [Lactobacillales bacterium]
MKKQHDNIAVAIITVFIGSVLLTASLIATIISLTVFNPGFPGFIAGHSNYYTSVAKEARKTIADYSQGSGVPHDVLDKVISDQQVHTDIDNMFQAFYDARVDYKSYAKDIVMKNSKEAILKYATDNDIALADGEASVDALAKDIGDIYSSNLASAYVKYVQKVTSKSSLVYMATAVLWILTLFFLAIFYFINKQGAKLSHRMYRNFGSLFITTGLMMAIGPLILLASNVIGRLNIASQSQYNFIVAFVGSIVWYFVFVGLASLATGGALAYMFNKTRNNLMKDLKTGRHLNDF